MSCFILNQDVVVFPNVRVESVLDSVFGSSRQALTDLGPSRSIFCVELNDFEIFCLSPLFSLDGGVEFVDVAFSDLLAGFSFQRCINELPVISELVNHLKNSSVFLRTPYFLLLSDLNKPSIPVQTLIFVSVFHHLGDLVPLFGEAIMQLK